MLLTLPHRRQLALSAFVRSTVLAPVLELQAGVADARRTSDTNQKLRAQRDSLAARLLELQGIREENRRLRGLLELSRRGKGDFRPANLYPTGRTGEFVKRSFALDVGETDGVEVNAAVVVPGGLLGVVRAVSDRQALGDFWTHQDFRVSAMTEDGAVFGIIRPLDGARPLMQVDGVPYQVELEAGVRLVTSGLGGVFPQGILIGHVVEPLAAQAGWERSYLVEPAVYPDAIREVMVLGDGGAGANDVEGQTASTADAGP